MAMCFGQPQTLLPRLPLESSHAQVFGILEDVFSSAVRSYLSSSTNQPRTKLRILPSSPIPTKMRDRQNSTAESDVIMSEPADVESPTTDPSTYSDAQQVLSPTPSASNRLPKPVANSLLFTLPKELRLRIYAYCLTSKYSVMWPTPHLALHLQPQLLLTCSTVYEEAIDVLYGNMLHFSHPSDANMFLWAHNPELGRGITKIVFTIRDKDVSPLWASYLSSTKPERSLLNDYPNLKVLHIQFRSAYMHAAHARGDIAHRFERWESESSLREMLLGTKDRVPVDCDVKVLVSCRMLADDARALCLNFPGELDRVREDVKDGRVMFRTPWKRAEHADVALELEGVEQARHFGP